MKTLYTILEHNIASTTINESIFDLFRDKKGGDIDLNPFNILSRLMDAVTGKDDKEKESDDARRARELFEKKQEGIKQELEHRMKMAEAAKEKAHAEKMRAIAMENAKKKAKADAEEKRLNAEIAKYKKQTAEMEKLVAKGIATESDLQYWANEAKKAQELLPTTEQDLYARQEDMLVGCFYDDNGKFIENPNQRAARGKSLYGDDVFEQMRKESPKLAEAMDNPNTRTNTLVQSIANVESEDTLNRKIDVIDARLAEQRALEEDKAKAEQAKKDREEIAKKKTKANDEIKNIDDNIATLNKAKDLNPDKAKKTISSSIGELQRIANTETDTENGETAESKIKKHINDMSDEDFAAKFPGLKKDELISNLDFEGDALCSDDKLKEMQDKSAKSIESIKAKAEKDIKSLEAKKETQKQIVEKVDKDLKEFDENHGIERKDGDSDADIAAKYEENVNKANNDLESWNAVNEPDELKQEKIRCQEEIKKQKEGAYEVDLKERAKKAKETAQEYNYERAKKDAESDIEDAVKKNDVLGSVEKSDDKGDYVEVIDRKDPKDPKSPLVSKKVYRKDCKDADEYATYRQKAAALQAEPKRPEGEKPKPEIGDDGKPHFKAEDMDKVKEWEVYKANTLKHQAARETLIKEFPEMEGCFDDGGFNADKYAEKTGNEINVPNKTEKPEEFTDEDGTVYKKDGDKYTMTTKDGDSTEISAEEFENQKKASAEETGDAQEGDERTDNDDDLSDDEGDDENGKPKQDPRTVWKQRTYKRGDKTFKTNSYYNKKGNSISKEEFHKKLAAFNKRKNENHHKLMSLRDYITENYK